MNVQLTDVISVLKDLDEDATVPKNIKTKIKEIMNLLASEDAEISIKVNKALNLLDDIADDINIKSYTRTQIWNAVSLLEKV